MIVLAVESDSRIAAKVRHVVCDLVKARLVVVRSVELAIGSLPSEIPDVILLPALVSPADESRLVDALRHQPDCVHVEILMTPALEAEEGPETVAPRGWRRWAPRRAASRRANDELRVFAERIGFSLVRARQQKELAQKTSEPLPPIEETAPSLLETTEPLPETAEPAKAAETISPSAWELPDPAAISTAPDPVADHVDDDVAPIEVVVPSAPAIVWQRDRNRRANPRFPASELQGLRDARIQSGPRVSLLDVSVGGALIETETRLQPESEAVLELVGSQNQTHVPFRVVRSQAMIVNGALRYRGACAFSESLDLADLLERRGPSAALSPGAAFDDIVEALQRLRSDRPPSSALEREALSLVSIAMSPSNPAVAITPPEKALDGAETTATASSANVAHSESDPENVEDPANRRQHIRVYGPFDGLRLGAIETPVTIRDLSEGGCFVDSLVDAKAGRRLSIGLLVPGEDWITATGEVVRGQPDFGFAVRFVELPEETRARLARVVAARSGSGVTAGKIEPVLAFAS